MTVLVADDDATTRSTIAQLVKQLGHSVLLAEDGAEAKHLFDAVQPEAVLTDWMMPNVDGVELCRYIRSHPGGRGTCILMITVRDGEWSKREALEAGANDYVVKPVQVDALAEKLNRITV